MILSDNETVVDLLNKDALANAIVRTISGKPEQPITVGVHGDWGAGKSSILEMVNKKFSTREKTVCIKFNSWRFQGFGDAKISIIEGIITELISEQSILDKTGELARDVLKRVDWMKVVRLGGSLAINVAAGIPPLDQLTKMFDDSKEASNGSINPEFVGKLTEYFNILRENSQTGDSKKIPEEVSEFLVAFEKLIEKAGIDQLVVLIDDLDRCLPNVVVETLEAIRLFLFTRKTAFVIAADEEMVGMSVRKHFPQKTDSQRVDDYARKYLEKLIQVPFHISAMSDSETQIYVTLLLIGEVLRYDNENYKKLIERAKLILKKPWTEETLDRNTVKNVLEADFDSVEKIYTIIEKINPVIVGGSKGNPRQIKRFLNALLLRMDIADERGFLMDLNLQILTKLLLVEQFQPPLFDLIAKSSYEDNNGVCKEVSVLENTIKESKKNVIRENSENQMMIDDLEKFTKSKTSENQEFNIWLSEEAKSWLKLEPSLHDVDLRPYLFIANVKNNSRVNQ